LALAGITLQFDLDRDINAASRDVQAAIMPQRGQLPAGLPKPADLPQGYPAETDILDLAVLSDTVPRGRLYDLCDSFLAQKNIPGRWGRTGPHLWGSETRVRVDLNPNALAHYGIGLEEVRAALRSANAKHSEGGSGKSIQPVDRE